MPTLALFAEDLFLVLSLLPAMSRVVAFDFFFTDFPLVSRTVRWLLTGRSPLVFCDIAGMATMAARRMKRARTICFRRIVKKVPEKHPIY
jgi:hypothetical protein